MNTVVNINVLQADFFLNGTRTRARAHFDFLYFTLQRKEREFAFPECLRERQQRSLFTHPYTV